MRHCSVDRCSLGSLVHCCACARDLRRLQHQRGGRGIDEKHVEPRFQLILQLSAANTSTGRATVAFSASRTHYSAHEEHSLVREERALWARLLPTGSQVSAS